MPAMLDVTAFDKSTYVVDMSFTDSLDQPVVPTSVTFTLKETVNGTVVNSRLNVAITPLAAEMKQTLYGEDINIEDGNKRRFIVDAVYDSDEGNDLPLRGAITFAIEGEDTQEPDVTRMTP